MFIEIFNYKKEQIPLTFRSLFYELYYYSFIGYLSIRSLNYIWDQLCLLYDWNKFLEITIQIFSNNNSNAINLFNLIKKYLRQLSVQQLKKIINLK